MTLKKILGVAGDVTVEALIVSGSLLEHIPVPYLQRVCNMFISIWKAVQQVSVSLLHRFARLSLTGLADEPPGFSPFDADVYDNFGFYIQRT